MARVAAFVDGFNLYHALDDNPAFHKYKWLNLAKLVRCFVRVEDEIKAIFYFTAYATWAPKKVEKHKNYVRALELEGVKPIFGQFRQKDRKCPKCKKAYTTFEEKETDVNIAIKLFQTAIADLYDTALIVSGDSDLIPALEAVKQTFPNKKIVVVIPIGRRAEALKHTAHAHMKMKSKHLETCQFEDEIRKDNLVLLRPASWK